MSESGFAGLKDLWDYVIGGIMKIRLILGQTFLWLRNKKPGTVTEQKKWYLIGNIPFPGGCEARSQIILNVHSISWDLGLYAKLR